MIETVGLGGVGKTQVAAEYCYRHYSSYYGLVMWWRAETPEVLASDVRRFAEDTGIVVQVRELLVIFLSFLFLLCFVILLFFSFLSPVLPVVCSNLFLILSVDLKKLKKFNKKIKKEDESSRLFCFSSSSSSCCSCCSSCISSSSSSSFSLPHRE